jgi:hypothetical protein
MRNRWGITSTLAAALCVLAFGQDAAQAQISGASVSTSGSSCSGDDADGFCGFSAAIQTNNGTTLATRYAWNINTDIGIFSTRDSSGTAQHNVGFTATAPGGYRLNIVTTRVGDMNRVNDAVGCDGSANVSGVTGSSNISLNSGSLNLTDPGSIGVGDSTTSIPFSQSSGTAQIFRVSNGVGQSHSLTFTWTGNTRSNSCEAAVRIGEQNGSTTGCSACGYPGSPSRTQASDGHFVTVTYASLCGNGTIDGSVSEQCDEGSANGSFTSCCTTQCRFKTAGTDCSTSAGLCDPIEECTGSSGDCPADVLSPAGTDCRPPAGVCDALEECTGTSPGCPFDFKLPGTTQCRAASGACNPADFCAGGNNCPADTPAPSGTLCRASAGVCDAAETCNGTSLTCPADSPAPPSTVCRPASTICDVAETCSGFTCPADGFASSSVVCRAQAGLCDVAENCTGSSATCPVNGFASAGVECRAAAGDCDVAEVCPGGSPSCPGDAIEPAGVECRAAAGDCDEAEECTGLSVNCPIDSVSGAFVECRPSAGICDAAENCDGVGVACPADAPASPSTVCRASADDCDVAETCSGFACPADGFASASTECRAQNGDCDVAENCTGSGPACPADGFAPSSQECRASADQCDAAENCTGSGPTCPADGDVPDGTTCSDGNACSFDDECVGGTCTPGMTVTCNTCEICDPGGGCIEAPRTGCNLSTQPLKSKMLIKDTTPDDVDKLIWKWIKGEAVTTPEFGDPLATDDYAFCVFDPGGLVMSAAIPAGGTCGTKPCWKALNGKGYKYVNKAGTPEGITKLLLKSGGAGLSKVIAKGKGVNLIMPDLPLTLNVTAQIQSENGECWQTVHSALGTSRNDDGQFKSKDGSPSGAFVE